MIKKFICFMLTLCLLWSCGLESFAFAGEGTTLNPYTVSTAEEFLAIADDLTAHYILTADIDLSGVSGFEPIGNSQTGAFTGSLDGNSKTISGLTINTPDEKYTGLIGYNEGTVKNLNISGFTVVGGRYVGAVVGYNSSDAVVFGCNVNADVSSSDASPISVNVGGAVGYNAGEVTNVIVQGAVEYSTSEDVYGDVNVGGIIGVNSGKAENIVFSGALDYSPNNSVDNKSYIAGCVALNSGELYSAQFNGSVNGGGTSRLYLYAAGIVAHNTGSATNLFSSGKLTFSGTFFRYAYVGGVIGYNSGPAEITGNETDINFDVKAYSAKLELYAGGFIGYNAYSIKISDAVNYGDIYIKTDNESTSDWREYMYNTTAAGGLIGRNSAAAEIINCANKGDITAWAYHNVPLSGGIVAMNYSNLSVKNCFNTSLVTSSESSNYYYSSYWGGRYLSYASGIVGISYNNTLNIDGCYNSGTVTCNGSSNRFSAAILASDGTPIVKNCYNTGIIKNNVNNFFSYASPSYSSNIGTTATLSTNLSGSTNINLSGKTSGGSYFSGWFERAYRRYFEKNYDSLDFENIWTQHPDINGGVPYFKHMDNWPVMSDSVKDVQPGDSFTLSAYQNRQTINVTSWSTDNDKIATVSDNGVVTAVSAGVATITAVTENGMRANCVVNVLAHPDTETALNDVSIDVNISASIKAISDESDEVVVWAESSDTSVCTVSFSPVDKLVTIKGIDEGTAVITVETALGTVKTFKVTVTNNATGITLPSSQTVGRGVPTKLNVTFTPTGSDANISWVSSDPLIATVDEDGCVTGVNIGTTMITAQTDSGLVASCTINVMAPVTNLAFDPNQVTVVAGDKKALNLVVTPYDTTDKITYSSSNTSYVTVDSSTGVVTAVKAGSATITATSESGVVVRCAVVVINEPIKADSVSISLTNLNIKGGESYTLEAAINPSDATDKRLIWTVEDETIAAVDEIGRVTGLSSGSTVVTVSTYDGSCSASCRVNVTVDVTGVTLGRTTLTMHKGKTFYLNAQVQPAGATNKTVYWESDNTSVATVDENGMVTAIDEGLATVTVTTENWGKTASCVIDVSEEAVTVNFERETVYTVVGKPVTLVATVTPSNVSCANLVWSSSDETVATVLNDGTVIPSAVGNVTITAATDDGCSSASCTVTVVGINSATGTKTVIDTENSLIYGVDIGFKTLNDYIVSSDEICNLEYTPTDSGWGTGAKVVLTVNEETVGIYTLVIFGDVNGDGWYDGEDAFLVNLIAKGMLDRDDVGEAIWTAADCNHDGEINEADVDLLSGAGLKLNDVDQTKPVEELATNSDYIEYVMLIDQSAGFDVEPDTDETEEGTTTPETNETVEPDEPATENNIDFEVIFTNILELFKKIFAFVFSFVIK